MNQTEIYQRLTEIFRDIFDDDALTIGSETTAADIEDWDSLTQMTLLAAVEDEFGIRFDIKAVDKLKNVGELAELIGRLLA